MIKVTSKREYDKLNESQKMEWLRQLTSGQTNIAPAGFTNRTARDKLVQLKGCYIYKDGMTAPQVEKLVNEIIHEIKCLCGILPCKISKWFNIIEGPSQFSDMSVTICPLKKNVLPCKNLDRNYKYPNTLFIFDTLIADIGEWLDLYEYYTQLDSYASELNTIIKEAINGKKFLISFVIGEAITDVSDKHVTIGIREDTLGKFSKEGYGNDWIAGAVIDLVDEGLPYHVLSIKKNELIDHLGIWTKETPMNLIKDIFPRFDSVKIGKGYHEYNGMFAVIERKEKDGKYEHNFVVSPFSLSDYEYADFGQEEAFAAEIRRQAKKAGLG